MQIKLIDLLYALMLPSGNDASLAIAVWGGKVLCLENINQELDMVGMNLNKKKKIFYDKFIEMMNLKAESLGM